MSINTEIDDGLTDEERAALAEEESAAGTTDEQASTTPDADEQREQEAVAAAEADQAKQQAEAAKAEANEESLQTEAKTEQAAPILVAPSTEDAEARLTEIATKKDALLTQFDDGDITAREYQKQLDELSKQERRIEFEVHEAQLAQKMEQQRLQNEWTKTCNDFVETHAIYKDNPRLYKALDAEVRELAGKPETANWSGQKFLDEAHKALKQAFGFSEPSDTGKPRANPAANLPPNLAKVPAAEVEDTNGGRFAVLDRLASADPLGYEDALAKMSDSERNAYLNA